MCLECQVSSNTMFEELIIQIDADIPSTEIRFRRWAGPEILSDYYCRK